MSHSLQCYFKPTYSEENVLTNPDEQDKSKQVFKLVRRTSYDRSTKIEERPLPKEDGKPHQFVRTVRQHDKIVSQTTHNSYQ